MPNHDAKVPQVSFMETKREQLNGHLYESGNGQLVIDSHASDAEHVTAPQTRASQPLYDCRQYVRDLIPKEWIGRHGTFMVDRITTTTGEPVSVSISFVPKVEKT